MAFGWARRRDYDRLHREARDRLASSEKRERAGVGGAHGAHSPSRRVITDGGKGFEKARRAVWPNTRVQRCVFHAFCQVKRQTTTRPRLQAGVELYGIAKKLMRIGSLNEAAEWLAGFSNWCTAWEGFLKEKEVVDGRIRYKHERLRTARGGLLKLCRAGTLFTYLDEACSREDLFRRLRTGSRRRERPDPPHAARASGD